MTIDAMDRQVIAATQAGLPLVSHPYAAVAAELGISEAEVIDRLSALQEKGIVRRIALAPNHFRLGMVKNGMTVWDVADAQVSALGRQVGALDFVTHCYRRPRALPDWPYNLFAMVHGTSDGEVEAKRAAIAALLGAACNSHDILYSTRILKKSGMRLRHAKG